MATTIKITELADIGNNLSGTTLIPVVKMTGTPETEKANLNSIANVILSNAGVTFATAARAILAQTVSNAAQPNITSVGTLLNLDVSGTANVGLVDAYNLNVANAISTVDLNSTGNAYLTDITVSAVSTLGDVGNVKITGGASGQVLSTDGTGNLSWVAGGGGGGSGATGATGPTGATGAAGNDGATGATGPTGPAGADGSTGPTGATGSFNGNLTGNVDANGFNISNAGNITANYFVGVATDVVVEAVNNNYSYHVVLTTGPGDSTLHNDIDDNFQYNPQEGVLTVSRVDAGFVLTNNLWYANGTPYNVTGATGATGVVGATGLTGATGPAGAALPIANGISSIDIATSGGNVTVKAGSANNWIFGTDAVLSAPNGSQIVPAGNNFNIYTNDVSGAVQFFTDVTGNNHNWSFDGYGYTNLPFSQGFTNTAVITSVGAGNIMLQAGAGPTQNWNFDSTGNLTLPGNTFAVNYANGTQVSLGGGGNTGNVTFSDQTVIGTGDEYGGGGLYLAPGTNSSANLQFLRVRGGDYPTHIHLDTGNNNYFDQYFGADFRYVKLEANGNIVINADDDEGNSATWTFDTTGNLTLPGNTFAMNYANGTQVPLGGGATGATGAVGATGAPGATGPEGASGPIGATGTEGATGPQGATGPEGLAGPVGSTGASGEIGATGSQGATGLQGDMGSTGATGLPGIDGATGATGASGLQGDIGSTGATGANGLDGATGATGASGIQGLTGATGSVGASGPEGATGATGLGGAIGPEGATGATGAGLIGSTVYASLPSPTAGARGFITDGNLVAAGNFAAQVSGGGANSVPVYSDGTNWYIG